MPAARLGKELGWGLVASVIDPLIELVMWERRLDVLPCGIRLWVNETQSVIDGVLSLDANR